MISSAGKSKRDLLIWASVTCIILGALGFVASSFLTLENVQRIGKSVSKFAVTNQTVVFGAIVLAQTVGMTLSLPTKAIITLLSGALLGALLGSLSTMVGVLMGTTILFCAVRHFFRDRFAEKMGARVRKIERRISERPIRAMIGIRLLIALPYGPCTITAALSSMRYRDFLLGTIIGDSPVIILYAFAGKQLFTMALTGDALSPSTIAILMAAGLVFVAATIFGKKPKDGLVS